MGRPFFFRKEVPGSLLLPRHKAGQINWPRCARCKRIVDAYGVENESDTHVEIWAKCSGIAQDPDTGLSLPFATRKHHEMKSSVVIMKGPGWSAQRLTDIISRQAFFAIDGDRAWAQNLTREGLKAV